MANKINSNINTGFMKFTFSDEDGDVFASFKLNPTDPRLMERCKNISKYFADVANSGVKVESIDDMISFELQVESKFCEFLGYDCRQSLFGQVAATDTMADGNIFAQHILDTIIASVASEIKKRRQENIAKHTAKYTGGIAQ